MGSESSNRSFDRELGPLDSEAVPSSDPAHASIEDTDEAEAEGRDHEDEDGIDSKMVHDSEIYDQEIPKDTDNPSGAENEEDVGEPVDEGDDDEGSTTDSDEEARPKKPAQIPTIRLDVDLVYPSPKNANQFSVSLLARQAGYVLPADTAITFGASAFPQPESFLQNAGEGPLTDGAPPPKRRRRRRIQERDEGYDKDDPFVDDSEALTMEPKFYHPPARDGFYVASGLLELNQTQKSRNRKRAPRTVPRVVPANPTHQFVHDSAPLAAKQASNNIRPEANKAKDDPEKKKNTQNETSRPQNLRVESNVENVNQGLSSPPAVTTSGPLLEPGVIPALPEAVHTAVPRFTQSSSSKTAPPSAPSVPSSASNVIPQSALKDVYPTSPEAPLSAPNIVSSTEITDKTQSEKQTLPKINQQIEKSKENPLENIKKPSEASKLAGDLNGNESSQDRFCKLQEAAPSQTSSSLGVMKSKVSQTPSGTPLNPISLDDDDDHISITTGTKDSARTSPHLLSSKRLPSFTTSSSQLALKPNSNNKANGNHPIQLVLKARLQPRNEGEALNTILEKALAELKVHVDAALPFPPKKFPGHLKPLTLKVAHLALDLKEYDDYFFLKLAEIFPYNTFTIKKLVKREILPQRKAYYEAEINKRIEQLKPLIEEGMPKARADYKRALQDFKIAKVDFEVKLKEREAIERSIVNITGGGDGNEDSNGSKTGGSGLPANAATILSDPLIKKAGAKAPGKVFVFNENIKKIYYEIIKLDDELWDMIHDTQKIIDKNATWKDSDHRRALYRRLSQLWPDDFASTFKLSKEAGIVRKLFEGTNLVEAEVYSD
ncbi:expressed protein [Phakopsora pachyrhizi]|uniref:Expressed protein n=1 Tax=Phakopsora pachyrhizi TaxID=170000 RepID=A0AAV0AZU1_PHAPC|nr:expressed protein [Phakopsora pachyrhizi]